MQEKTFNRVLEIDLIRGIAIIFMIFDPNNILSKSKLASSVSEQSLTTIKVVVSTFLILFGFLSTVFLC